MATTDTPIQPPTARTGLLVLRGAVLHFRDDPATRPDGVTWEYFDDGLLIATDGRITHCGEAKALLPALPRGAVVTELGARLILPGFVDTHTHFVQTDIVAAYGRRLLEWLEDYTFPAERAFADPAHARAVAAFFLDELLRNGTTAALVLGSVHPVSVDAVFEAARSRGMHLAAGKVMMDRHCPDWLRDTAQTSYDDSLALIARWHGVDRLRYAVTPRFAPTSTDEQLTLAGRLAAEHADVLVQTHLAENQEELAWVKSLYPDARSYLDVYDRFGLVGPRTVLAHGIWLDEADRTRIAESGASIAHCPCCNLFMGSGLFDLDSATTTGVQVAFGTDIGGGTSFSLLRVMHEAYKVAQLRGSSLTPERAFYLATLGGARALGAADRIGNFAPGKEADIVVLDPAATPLLARRMQHAHNLRERLFALMMLGDEHAVERCYVLGRLRHQRNRGSAP
jgi:guanine deaminase